MATLAGIAAVTRADSTAARLAVADSTAAQQPVADSTAAVVATVVADAADPVP
jgi:hypothetical protein